jgi:hypothetical protein
MWIVLGAAALVVVLVVVIVVFRRPRADDLHSVRSYHSALGTLETMSDRPGQPASGPPGTPDRSSVAHVRPRFYSRASAESEAVSLGQSGHRDDLAPGVDGGGDPPGTAGGPRSAGHSGSVPPVPLRDLDAIGDPATPLVFDDSLPEDHHHTLPAAQGSQEIAPVVRLDRAQRHALESMNRRPRRITTVSIVVIVVVVFAVLAVVGSRRSNSPHHSPSASATTSPSHRPGGSTTATTTHGAKGKSGGKKAKTKAPPTTVPTRLVALASTPTSATYSVATETYTVTVSASGPCWVGATTVATGSTLWEGTLQAGDVQVIQASGLVTVQLGTTAATIKVGKLPVVLPSPVHSPFLATFQTPSTASSATTTPATAATTATTATTSTTTAPPAG